MSANCNTYLQVVDISVVCQTFSAVSPTKMAEPFEMPFGIWTLVGPRNHLLDDNFWCEYGGLLQSIGTLCRELCKNGCTNQDEVWDTESVRSRNHVLDEMRIGATLWIRLNFWVRWQSGLALMSNYF